MTRRQLLLLLGVAPLGAAPSGSSALGDGPCAVATSSITIAGQEEPGRRMVVSGQVFLPDGRTPAAGIIMFAWHTDVNGLYSPDHSVFHPRLRGWMKTDVQGRYEYRTIRPEPYPQRTNPAHVHVQFWGPGVPAQAGEELLFADDPLIKAEDRKRSAGLGRFAFVQKGESRGGVLYLTQDFHLHGPAPFGNALFGVEPCHITP
jgi:protocatechuate 3,4-dioxygenase, beta subunit